MSKAVDLTGLSRAITNIEEWVLGQRTHYGVEKTFYAADIARLSGTLSFEGYANYALIDIVLSGLETTLKLNRHGNKAYSYVQSYNNYKVDLYLDWKENYTQFGYTDISWEIRVEDNFPLHVEDFENIKIVVPQKLLPEIYIPDTIARTEQVEEIREETTALWENLDHGVFPNLVAGDLVGRGESVPAEFSFRASGGKSIKDGAAWIKRLKGNSVVWNQKFPDTYLTKVFKNRVDAVASERLYTCTVNSIAYTFVGIYFDREQISIIPTHRYLVSYVYKGGKNAILQGGIDSQKGRISANANIATQFAYIDTANNGTLSFVMSTAIESMEVGDTFTVSDIKVIDLTQLFQAGNEPTTIEEFNARKPIVADEYAYNAGEVIHMTAEGIKSVGDNAWDEEWGMGRLNTNTGQVNAGNIGIYSKNYIKVLPNETYYCGYNAAPIFAMFYDAEYALITGVNGSNNFVSIRNTQFTTPANAAYMKFYVADDNLATYNHDIMITLVHSGWKQDTDAGYQPYWQDILPLPIISKYFPDGMKSAGSAHDEIRFNKASGKWEKVQRIGEVDMGSLDWEVASNNRMIATSLENVIVRKEAANDTLLCAKYTNAYPSEVYLNSYDNIICSTNVGHIFVYDSAYTDAATFKADMAGVMLYYELAEPTIIEYDEPFNLDYKVADFGTEEIIASQPSAPISADIIYQFNAVDMIREHEIEINELQAIIATMQAQLASLTSNNE